MRKREGSRAQILKDAVGSKEGVHCGLVSREVLWALGVAVSGRERKPGQTPGLHRGRGDGESR